MNTLRGTFGKEYWNRIMSICNRELAWGRNNSGLTGNTLCSIGLENHIYLITIKEYNYFFDIIFISLRCLYCRLKQSFWGVVGIKSSFIAYLLANGMLCVQNATIKSHLAYIPARRGIKMHGSTSYAWIRKVLDGVFMRVHKCSSESVRYIL